MPVWPTPEPDLLVRDERDRSDPQRVEQLWQASDRRLIGVHNGRIDLDPSDSGERMLLGTADGVRTFA